MAIDEIVGLPKKIKAPNFPSWYATATPAIKKIYNEGVKLFAEAQQEISNAQKVEDLIGSKVLSVAVDRGSVSLIRSKMATLANYTHANISKAKSPQLLIQIEKWDFQLNIKYKKEKKGFGNKSHTKTDLEQEVNRLNIEIKKLKDEHLRTTLNQVVELGVLNTGSQLRKKIQDLTMELHDQESVLYSLRQSIAQTDVQLAETSKLSQELDDLKFKNKSLNDENIKLKTKLTELNKT
jgi:cell division protein FtsB